MACPLHLAQVAWRGDNAGPPPNVSDVVADFEAIQKQFPGAEIVVSTFDKFAAVVNAGIAAGTVHIPTITSEVRCSAVRCGRPPSNRADVVP